jgi:N6-adenosine-specific RNA methylase IME4
VNFQTVQAQATAGAAWPFGGLTPFSYDLLFVDPAWPIKMRSEKGEAKSYARHYGAMSWDAIKALPVGHLAKRDAVLVLCCCSPIVLYGGDPQRHYRDADAGRSLPGEIMHAYGFRFVGVVPWLKRRSKGGIAYGTGYRFASATEPFLVGLTGSPNTVRQRNLIDGLAREHSRKPEEAYAWCERFAGPGARLCELFSRASRPGWDSWGLEAGKFDPVVSLNAPAVAA